MNDNPSFTLRSFYHCFIELSSDFRWQVREWVKLYGRHGRVLPLLFNMKVWQHADHMLKVNDEKIFLDFVGAQIDQANMVAVTGSTPRYTRLHMLTSLSVQGAIMAQVAISALALNHLSSAH